MGEWLDPSVVVSDGLFDQGARVEARMKDGGVSTINFGYVTDEPGSEWLAFYDDDGQEVLLWEIEAVRLAQRDMQEVGG